MDMTIKSAAWIVILALLASCSDGPSADPELKLGFAPVMTHQSKDLTVSCDALQSEVNDTGHKMRVLDKQIAFHQLQTQRQSATSAAFGALTKGTPSARTAPLDGANSMQATAQSDSENNPQMDSGKLRANYTQRHQALIRIYFARCVLG